MGKKCSEDGCETYSIYGLEKNTPLHCKKHKLDNEKDVLNKMCEKCKVKQASYGLIKKKPIWCKTCKSEDAFDVKHKMCENEQCNTRPTFGTTKAIRCLLHKKQDDKPFGYKYCEVKNCKLIPSFSDNIDNVALRCSKHKLANWVDVSHGSAMCKFENCIKQGSYGLVNGKVEYCLEHKKENMIDIKHSRCIFDGCDIQATFGELNGKRIYCTTHKEDTHISLNYMINGELYTALYKVFCSVKSKDKKLNRTFYLTMDFLLNLYETQNKQCFYCNNTLNVKNYNKKHLDQVSIDRKDSNLGHLQKNSILCCLHCNWSKHNNSVDTYKLFLKFIKTPTTKHLFDIEDKTINWITPMFSTIKTKNPETNITRKWLKEQFEQQMGLCKYTKIPMIITETRRFIFQPSIERVNCDLSYTKDNCVLVTLGANLGRNDFPLEDYLDYVKNLKKRL